MPGYIEAEKSGKLEQVKQLLFDKLKRCDLCPRNCQVNRLDNKKGVCRTGKLAMVSSFGPHYGEEDCLVGRGGSGTIFFTNCNLLCCFCQNYDISHLGRGEEVSDAQLAEIMLILQAKGCHNINLVTPTHVIPQIVAALQIACNHGLTIPIVYNSGGYETVESIKLLEGIVDIYMPDFKFSDSRVAAETCNAPDYFETAKTAIAEMHRQVGDLKVDSRGIACRGLLVRHLVMPENLAGTEEIMEFIANEISENTFVNIMSQYRPCGNIEPGSVLNRPVTRDEFRQACEIARSKGLHNLGQGM